MSLDRMQITDTLTPEDALTIKYLEYTVEDYIDDDKTDNKEIEQVKNWLLNYSPELIYRLTQNSETLKDFCRFDLLNNDNAETGKKIITKWSAILTNGGYPDLDITPMNGEKKLCVFDHLMSYLEYAQFVEKSSRDPLRMNFLDKSCEHGLYNALVARCKINLNAIQHANGDDKKIEKAIAALQKDTEKLSLHYWGLGYFQSASFMHAAATHILELAEIELGKDNMEFTSTLHNQGMALLGQAVKSFLCASYVENSTISHEIIQHITQGEGLASLISNAELQFSDWSTAKYKFQDWIGDDYTAQENDASDETKNLLAIFESKAKENGNAHFSFASTIEKIKKMDFYDILTKKVDAAPVEQSYKLTLFQAINEAKQEQQNQPSTETHQPPSPRQN